MGESQIFKELDCLYIHTQEALIDLGEYVSVKKKNFVRWRFEHMHSNSMPMNITN